ncbi:YheU family protein [Isoalcanivorax indicus]|uniref:YheU family protein n=1 Tax=Isoalcanivorax indicus TaxID=2202653 RepID=UPI000DB9A74A|nr:YheU family protein [Isoalcanivorax indicus]
MRVPPQAIPAETLQNLIEEFVTRDGTDYGEREISLSERVTQVERLLAQGEMAIWFDEATETVSLLTRRQMQEAGLGTGEER